MAEETDGIEEAFKGQLRVLVTVAGQVGERLARAREEALRNAQARSEQEHRELQSRIEAERRAARVEMANVHRSDWWDRATPEQIGRTYQLARAWSQEDPEAVRTEQRVRDEVRARYGIDVNDAGADPEAVRQRIRVELDRAERDRAGGDAERGRSAAEHAEAQRLLDQANQEDQRADTVRAAAEGETPLGPLRPYTDEERASPRIGMSNEEAQRLNLWAEEGSTRSGVARDEAALRYDSAERREGTARDLEAQGIDRETVATRMRADVSQAKPATEAVGAGAAGRRPKARKTRGRAAQQQVQRPGLGR